MANPKPQNPRIFVRNETAAFTVGFFADDNLTTPLVPISPSYPSYTVYDPNGTPIQTGVGTPSSPAGYYQLDWLIPKDAPLTFFQQAPQQYNDQGEGAPLTASQSGRYRIEWIITTADQFTTQYVEEFDVRDAAVTQSHNRELKYLTLSGKKTRVLYRTTDLPLITNLTVSVRGNDACPIVQESLNLALPDTAPGSQGAVKYAKDGDSYVLYYDIPENTTLPNTCYVILWEMFDQEFSPPQIQWQVLVAITSLMFPLMTSLRMLIDKFQKRIGRLQAYEDSDLLEYLSQGNRMVNLGYPTTSYALNAQPDDLLTFVVLAAAWWGLNAQGILETDLSFNFSGQSVTMSVDRASQLDAHMSKLMEWYNTNIGPAKMAYVRKARGTGTVAGRAYSYRTQYQYVYKISSIGSDGLLTALTRIGLL